MRLNRKQILGHILVWAAWILVHILSDIISDRKLDWEDMTYTIFINVCVAIPLSYLTYFIAFKYYDKHHSKLLLILTLAVLAVLYVYVEFGFQRFIVPVLNTYPGEEDFILDRSFFVFSINRYIFFYLPIILIYWYYSGLVKSRLKEQALQMEKLKTENEKLQSDYNFYKMQINPHFIFNCLQSVDNYILKNDEEKASSYLRRFSSLMRRTMQYGPDTEIKLSDEITNLELYLQLEQMRYDSKFGFAIDSNGVEAPDFITIPSMIIQPYVENAVKHGMARAANGHIQLKFTEKPDALICTIEDNGIGINEARKIKADNHFAHISMGTDITSARVNAYNNLGRGKIVSEITDLSELPGGKKGTRVTLYFYVHAKHDI